MLKKFPLIIGLLFLINNNYSQEVGIKRVSSVKTVEQYMEVEAENFFKQSLNSNKSWYITNAKKSKKIKPDPDKKHLEGASNGAYIEALPETFIEGVANIEGVNFSKTPGAMAVLKYKVNFKKKGQYFVWIRGYCTSSEDNSIHVGIDNKWPKSGTGIYFCKNKNSWSWSSTLRGNSDDCDDRNQRAYIMIDKPGEHIIQFSMREDGFEFDKWVLTNKGNRIPN